MRQYRRVYDLEVNVSDQQKDPRKEGWFFSWAVVQKSPISFAGAFPSKDAAQAKAIKLGAGYYATYVTHLPGSDEFIVEDEPRG